MKTLSRTAAFAVTLIGLAVCVFMLIGGISLHKNTLSQNRTYTGAAEATVVDYEIRQEEMEVTDTVTDATRTELVDFYFPVFEYTVDGKDYRTVSDSGEGEKAYDEGSTVEIRYLPEDPSQFYIAGDSSRSFVPYIMYAISLVCAAVTVKSFLTLIKAK